VERNEKSKPMKDDSRPRWLLVCLALATALLTFRIVALLLTVLVTLADYAPTWVSNLARSWGKAAAIVIPLFCAILIARWQESALSSKSRKASYIALLVIAPLALFPLQFNIERTLRQMTVENVIKDMPLTRVTVDYRLVNPENDDAENLLLAETGEPLSVSKDVLLDLTDVEEAFADKSFDGFQVILRLNEPGTERLRLATERYQGRRLAVIVDGRVVAAAEIVQPIHDGIVAIPGPMMEVEAFHLAKRINFSIRPQ